MFFEDNPGAPTVFVRYNQFTNMHAGTAVHPTDSPLSSKVDATTNWWGAADGPEDVFSSSPTGSGVKTNLYEDNFAYDPWCTAANCSTLSP